MKKCPYCAGAVQDDAQVCPVCHMSLATAPAAPGYPAMPPAAVPSMAPMEGPTSGKAIASLICGILGFVILPIISAIPAIVLGHLSLSEIKRSAGRIKGQGMAIAGLVLGYLGIAMIPFILIIAAIAIPNLLRAKMAANESSAVGSIRIYNTALVTYATMCQQQGYPPSSKYLGPGNGGCSAANLVDGTLGTEVPVRNGYRFKYFPGAPDEKGRIMNFTIHADPVVQGSTGVRHFYTDQTGVIHFSPDGPADAESPELN